MIKTLIKIAMLNMALLFMPLSHANNMGADELIKHTSQQVLSTLSENKTLFEQHPEKIFTLINDIILPHLDFIAMSKLALGKNWRKANKQQRAEFTDAFKNMLMRTYSKALTEYTGQEVEFLPYRPPAEGKITVTVKTKIKPANGPAIPINYRLRIKHNIWKVFDIKIDGISLVTNYRNTFTADIRRVGMDGLIKKLKSKKGKSSKPADSKSS